jgi:hypothetical protein
MGFRVLIRWVFMAFYDPFYNCSVDYEHITHRMIVCGRLKSPHFSFPLSRQWIKKQTYKEILTGREKGNTQSWLQNTARV